MKTDLERQVDELRTALEALAERVRLSSVAEAFLCGDHEIREGDYFLLDVGRPTQLKGINGEGKWSYFDDRNFIEPFRIPKPGDYDRLYTAAEVAEVLAKAVNARAKSDQDEAP